MVKWIGGSREKSVRVKGKLRVNMFQFRPSAGRRPIKGQAQVRGISVLRTISGPVEFKYRNTQCSSLPPCVCFQSFLLKSMVLRGDPQTWRLHR